MINTHFSHLFILNIFSRINKINSEASRSSVMRICTKRLDCSTVKEKKLANITHLSCSLRWLALVSTTSINYI